MDIHYSRFFCSAGLLIRARRPVYEKRISILIMIFVLAFSTQADASTEEVASSSEGYLISDTGETVLFQR